MLARISFMMATAWLLVAASVEAAVLRLETPLYSSVRVEGREPDARYTTAMRTRGTIDIDGDVTPSLNARRFGILGATFDDGLSIFGTRTHPVDLAYVTLSTDPNGRITDWQLVMLPQFFIDDVVRTTLVAFNDGASFTFSVSQYQKLRNAPDSCGGIESAEFCFLMAAEFTVPGQGSPDWLTVAPIPLPAAAPLLLGGLGALAALRRGRARQGGA